MSKSSAYLEQKARLLSIKGILPFLLVGFINAFVDLGHKIVIQNTVFKVYEGSTLVFYTAFIQALILIPFLVVFTPAGFLSDKYAKDKVMRIASFSAIPITLLITLSYYQGWFQAAFGLTFALALQSALYSPSKYGFIKELVGAKNLASANSVIQALTIAAILIGTLSCTVIFEFFYTPDAKNAGQILQQVKIAGWLLVILATLEFILSLRIPRIGKNDPVLKFQFRHYLSTGYLRDNLKDAWSNLSIRHSIIGLSVFWGINQVLLSSFGAHLKEISNEESTLVVNGILAIAAIGIALGSWYAASMSRNFIETGLIPFGALGITVCLFLLPHVQHTWVFGLLFSSFGFFGGVLLVPFNSLIQYHTKENTAGHIIASNNFVQTLVMLAFLGGTILIAVGNLPQVLVFHILAVISVLALAYSIYVLPQSMIRQLLKGILTQRYRLQVVGIERIPAEGGVLFLGNHISWIDWALLQMACPRPIRFVMHRDYYEKWYLRWLLNRLQVIPISAGASANALAAVKTALQRGDVVALFPEGHISRNGHLSVFRSGFERAALGTGAMIVPFYIQGLWGSNYSFAAGKYRQSIRNLGARTITVAFGQSLKCESEALYVKQKVQELSIEAWENHIRTLKPLAQAWMRTAKRMGSSPAILGHDRIHYSGTKLLAAVLAFLPKINKLTQGESRVGLMLPPSAGGVIASLALLCRGKSLVHMNYTASPEILLACAQKANVKTLITSAKFREKLLQRGLDVQSLSSVCKIIDLETIKGSISKQSFLFALMQAFILPAWLLDLFYFSKVSLNDTAAILFSSGSEGTPKGIELTHNNIVGNIRQVSSLLNPTNDDIMLSTLPLFHAFGLTITTLMPLIEGIPLVTQPDPTDAKTLGRLCAEHQVTLLCGTSTFLRMYAQSKHVHPLMFRSIRIVVAGAEKLREDVRIQFRQKFGLEVFEGFGTTETTPVASVNIPDILMDDFSVQVGHKPGTVGLPLPGSHFRIVDPVTLEILPVGQDGLILIGGSQIMKGYLDDPDKTEMALIEIDGMRWYKTGDKGHVDEDGFLTIVDRYSRFAKLGGEMVSLAAVESKINDLMLSLEITDYLITSLPDAAKGERLLLLYTGNRNPDEVNSQVRSLGLPPLWIPSRAITLSELPRLGSGKLDYGRAKALAAQC